MGMDSYLYKQQKSIFDTYMSTLKEVRSIREKNADKISAAYKKYMDFVKQLKEKYPSFGRDGKFKTLAKHATKDEMCEFDELTSRYDELSGEALFNGVDTSPGEKLFYWRKPFGLHVYIVEHFEHEPGCDNCERIPLSKDGMERMLAEMKRARKNFRPIDNTNPFGSDEYWDIDSLNSTIEIFDKTLQEYKDDEQVYYYSWY